MKPAEYLKGIITNKSVVFNTMLYLGLSESEFFYIQAAWMFSTTKGNEFCPRDLKPILLILNPKANHAHRQYRNIVSKSLEAKGYFKFSYSNTYDEKYYTLDHGFNKLLDVIDLFEKAELLKLKKVSGLFGGVYYRTNSYKETRKDINRFLRVLRKETKKHLKHKRHEKKKHNKRK